MRTTVRNNKTMLSATMDSTSEEVTIASNQRYNQLLEVQIQRTATKVADFIHPAHATVTAQETNPAEQPTLTEEQRSWLIVKVINSLSFNSFHVIRILALRVTVFFTNKNHALVS
jgi:hypothetical protein